MGVGGTQKRSRKVGGLTKARQIRDLCVSLGIAMTIEDSWGGDITTAAIAHLAHSTPEELRFSATDFNSYVTVSTAEGAPKRRNGRMAASTEPGLGVRPRPKVLGRPLVVELPPGLDEPRSLLSSAIGPLAGLSIR